MIPRENYVKKICYLYVVCLFYFNDPIPVIVIQYIFPVLPKFHQVNDLVET